MEQLNLESSVEMRKRNVKLILTIIFFAFLLVFFLISIAEARSNFDEARFREFETGLIKHAIPKGKIIGNNGNYDSTILYVMAKDVVRYDKQLLYVLIISMIFFICQIFRKRFYAIPVVCAHIFILSIFYFCVYIEGVYSALGLPHLWRMEIITFRGTSSLVLYFLLLASMMIYFAFEIKGFIENKVRMAVAK